MDKYLDILTEEDMHSLLDYLAFLASRHDKERSEQKAPDTSKPLTQDNG